MSYSDVGEGGVAVNCGKTQFFLNTLYIVQYVIQESMINRFILYKHFFVYQQVSVTRYLAKVDDSKIDSEPDSIFSGAKRYEERQTLSELTVILDMQTYRRTDKTS